MLSSTGKEEEMLVVYWVGLSVIKRLWLDLLRKGRKEVHSTQDRDCRRYNCAKIGHLPAKGRTFSNFNLASSVCWASFGYVQARESLAAIV